MNQEVKLVQNRRHAKLVSGYADINRDDIYHKGAKLLSGINVSIQVCYQ